MKLFSDILETMTTQNLSYIFLATRDLTMFPLYNSSESSRLNGTELLTFGKNQCVDKKESTVSN